MGFSIQKRQRMRAHQRVQQRLIRARRVQGSVLCLSSGPRGIDEYVAVFQVAGPGYGLTDEETVWQLNEQVRTLLRTLSTPIQVLWRLLPRAIHDLLAPLAPLLAPAGAPGQVRTLAPTTALAHALVQERASTPEAVMQMLAVSQQHLFEAQFHKAHPLIERRSYLVVGIHAQEDQGRKGWWRLGRPRLTRAQHHARLRHLLEVRSQSLVQQLQAMNLTVHRLSSEDLVALSASCLTALRAPVPASVIASLGRPIRGAASLRRPPSPGRTPPPVSGDKTRQLQASPRSREEERQYDFPRLADLLAPAAVVIAADHVQLEEEYARVVLVHHLPREVASRWLAPLAMSREPVEVIFHIEPLDNTRMLTRLRHQQASYRSSLLLAQSKGGLGDPDLQVAGTDLDDLLGRLASGEDRMVALTMLVLVRARSREALEQRSETVQALLQQMGMVARTALFEQEQALRSTLPTWHCEVQTRILLDSRAAASLLPFLPQNLDHRGGVLEGITPEGDPVRLDRWHRALSNANCLIVGPSGVGKSYQVKISLLRRYVQEVASSRTRADRQQPRTHFIVLDPECEYVRVARALGGQVIHLAAGTGHQLNPFEVPGLPASHETPRSPEVQIKDHIQKLLDLFDLLLADREPDGSSGRLKNTEKSLLDRALVATYEQAGLLPTAGGNVAERRVPLLKDVYAVLKSGACGSDPTDLVGRLHRYVYGSLSSLFAGPTTIRLDEPLVVFDLHDLEEDLRPIGLFLVAHLVWTHSFGSQIPRQLIIDEAATLSQHAGGASFLEELLRRARKHDLRVTLTFTSLQEAGTLPVNCAIHLLFRQDSASLAASHLSATLREQIARLGIGEAVLLVGDQRLVVRFIATACEHLLASTAPRELAQWHQEANRRTDHARSEQMSPVGPPVAFGVNGTGIHPR